MFHVEGRCVCGQVRFIAFGEPLRVGASDSPDYRTTAGTAFSCIAVWPKFAFECTGAFQTSEGSSYCRTCGARIFSLREAEAEVMVGRLDDADLVEALTRAMFAAHAAADAGR